MARYIDSEQVVREILSLSQTDGIYGRGLKRGIELSLAIVNRQDTADVAEVKHGEWIDDIKDITPLNGYFKRKALVGYRCSVCNRAELRKEPYCNCGAKMDGGS